jgi:hypothetical protein
MKKLSILILSSLLVISLGFSTTSNAQSLETQNQNAVYHKTNIIELSATESDLPIEITPFGTDYFSDVTFPQGSEGLIGPMYTVSAGTRIDFQVNLKSLKGPEKYVVKLYKSGQDSPVYQSSDTAAFTKSGSYVVKTSARYYLSVANRSAVTCTYNGSMTF